ncbi:MAG: hypothetical protein AAF938_12420 [Myxococcota bacterium]
MGERERILITVKTYPTLSTKYGETVCTAGIRPDGSWVRLYPVPFRRLDQKQQYNKYDWLECRIIKHTQRDRRPESFRPLDDAELVAVEKMDTGKKRDWRARRELVLEKGKVYDSLDELIAGSSDNKLSLGTFRPTTVDEFIIEEDEREWDETKLAKMRQGLDQFELFSDNEWRETFKVVKKLPYKFSYRFTDVNGRESTLQVLDWELGALYWNCLRDAEGDEETALAKVRQKYFDEFTNKDLHFFMGTTLAWHFRAPNPWQIIGVFYPPRRPQIELF